MSYQPTDTGTPKLELNKSALESLTLYAHGLLTLTELSQRLILEDISISHVTTQFTDKCTSIQTGPKENDLYFHLSRRSGKTDERGFPIDDETCVVNL